jgi:hypothetical protein
MCILLDVPITMAVFCLGFSDMLTVVVVGLVREACLLCVLIQLSRWEGRHQLSHASLTKWHDSELISEARAIESEPCFLLAQIRSHRGASELADRHRHQATHKFHAVAAHLLLHEPLQ